MKERGECAHCVSWNPPTPFHLVRAADPRIVRREARKPQVCAVAAPQFRRVVSHDRSKIVRGRRRRHFSPRALELSTVEDLDEAPVLKTLVRVRAGEQKSSRRVDVAPVLEDVRQAIQPDASIHRRLRGRLPIRPNDVDEGSRGVSFIPIDQCDGETSRLKYVAAIRTAPVPNITKRNSGLNVLQVRMNCMRGLLFICRIDSGMRKKNLNRATVEVHRCGV